MSPTPEDASTHLAPDGRKRLLNLLLGMAACIFLASLALAAWRPMPSMALWVLPVLAAALVASTWIARQRVLAERPGSTWARKAQRLEALLDDVWLLRTDAQGRLRRIRAPLDAMPDDTMPPLGTLMPQAWECESAESMPAWEDLWTLPAAIPRRRVRRRGGPDAERWELCAQPVMDDGSRLLGHDVSLRKLPPAAQTLPAEVESDPFVYSVSHDLRAPLRIIQGFARILREDHAVALDHTGLDQLGRIENASQRMDAMIEALLSLSRLSSRPLEQRPVNLSEIAHSVIDDLRRTAPERQVHVRIDQDMACEGDPTLLRLVLENLLGNAWKYSARRSPAIIEFGVSQDEGAGRRYHVRDNGAGFDMRYADKLFAPFQRLHTASDFEGTGVGLASARRILQRHGGRLWGEGAVDQGACFYFTLP